MHGTNLRYFGFSAHLRANPEQTNGLQFSRVTGAVLHRRGEYVLMNQVRGPRARAETTRASR